MNIQDLIQKYAHLNRLIGDYRQSCANVTDHDVRYAEWKQLQNVQERMARVEDQLEDMGLLHFSDRYTDRAQGCKAGTEKEIVDILKQGIEVKKRPAAVEDVLEDLGLLDPHDRFTNRE